MLDILYASEYIQLAGVAISSLYLLVSWACSRYEYCPVYSSVSQEIADTDTDLHHWPDNPMDDVDDIDGEHFSKRLIQAHHQLQDQEVDHRTIQRILDSSYRIREKARKQNTIAYFLKLIGSTMIWSATVCITWREPYGRHFKRHYFTWLSPIIQIASWLYITFLSVIICWSRAKGLRQQINKHQVCLIISGYSITIMDTFIAYNFGRRFHYVKHSLIDVLVTIGVHLAIAGALLTRRPIEAGSMGRLESLEVSASSFEWITFGWMTPLIEMSLDWPLQTTDLWELPTSDHTEQVVKQCTLKSNKSIITSLIAANYSDIFFLFIYAILWSGMMYMTPLFLYLLLGHLERSSIEEYFMSSAWLYVLGLFLGTIGTNFCLQHGNFIGHHLLIRAKAVVSHKIIEKSLNQRLTRSHTSTTERGSHTPTDSVSLASGNQRLPVEYDAGTIANMLNVDTRNIGESLGCLHLLVGSVIQIVLAIAFLWRLIGVSTLVGVATMLFFFLVSNIITKKTTHVFEQLLAGTENCVSVVIETLYSMRIVKYLAWESHICARIIKARSRELKQLWRRHILYALLTMALDGGPLLVTCAALGMHTVMFNQVLTAQTAFTVLLLFELLRVAMLQLPFVLFWQVQAQISSSSINDYLNLPEISVKNEIVVDLEERIGFVQADFSWEPQHHRIHFMNREQASVNDPTKFALWNLNFDFRIGDFNIITGPANSGKSSMLLALLGEMPRIRGRAVLLNQKSTLCGDSLYGGTIAYVAQQTWLQEASIKENILFGQAYDKTRYERTLSACALTNDLNRLVDGDGTRIQPNDMLLTGSLRQRIALARAAYGPAHHILLDECFTEIDEVTTEYIIDKCLFGPLMYGRTRILATRHAEPYFYVTPFAVLLQNGRVINTGNLSSLIKEQSIANNGSLAGITTPGTGSQRYIRKPEPTAQMMRVRSNSSVMEHISLTSLRRLPSEGVNNPCNNNNHGDDDDIYTIDYFSRNSMSTLLALGRFISTGGNLVWWCFVAIIFVLYQLVSFLQNYWLRIWTYSNAPAKQHAFYFGNYAALSLSAVALIGLPPLLIYFSSIKSSNKIHMQLVNSILKTTAHSLDLLPIGDIIRRVSKDMPVVDQELPADLSFFLTSMAGIFVHLTVVCIVLPRFIIIAVVAGFLCIYLTNNFMKALRSLKRLEPEAKHAFFSLSSDIFNGIVTIRAAKMQHWFLAEQMNRIDNMHCPAYMIAATNQWIIHRVEWITACCTLIVAIMLLMSNDKADASLFGFIMTYTLSLASTAGLAIQYSAKIDYAMQSLKNVTDPIGLEQEWTDITLETVIPSPEWPEHGGIEFQNLSVDDTNYRRVLGSLWFSVHPGERIGIVGEAGAGKSAIAMALFRFAEAAEGRILIDGIDIGRVPLADLRSRLSIIPRDPVMFAGSIRSNLDPYWHHDDATIWNALRRCRLIGSDAGAIRPMGLEHLDAPLTENGDNLTYEQRKLLAVARALLREDKILLIEESPEPEDSKIEATIQEIVCEEFTQSTCLCIISKLATALNYDRIMVLDSGHLMEFDTPKTLLQRTQSAFQNLCQKSEQLTELLAKIGVREDGTSANNAEVQVNNDRTTN